MLKAMPVWAGCLCWAPALGWAQSCETLHAEIDAKIRAAGVANYTLVTTDIDAPTAGKVVGACGLGRRKIVYTATGPARSSAILTECKEGFTGADCSLRKPRSEGVAAEGKKPGAP